MFAPKLGRAMCLNVALGTKREQVLLGIVPRVAAKLYVVNFEI